MAKAATPKRAAEEQGRRRPRRRRLPIASARPSRSATRRRKDELLEFYKQMLLIRRFEERAGQLYGLGLIGGFCHLYIGQEAVAVGLQSALEVGKDSVITGYRDHGHMLAYGIDPKVIMAELTGRAAGICKGKGGSMHMFSVEHNFYGGHGIVGAQVSLGTGLAFEHKYAGDGGVCLAYFGDGAANQGQVYESFNMAELWKLPIIFVIENNQYAMGTSVNRSSAEDQLYKRGESFRIPGLQVDGMDVLAVRGAAETALEWVRAGKGPILLELKTYRYRGHSMSDPAKYRSREEVQAVREKSDPIEHAKRELEALGVERGRAEGDRQRDQEDRRRGRRFRRAGARARSGRALHRRAGGELLMPIELKMPALSPTMEEGTLAKWLVKEGDKVAVRRHPRRDRDRQGDDGVRGGRRRHDREDPRPRRHRRGEGRHRHRADRRRGRGRVGAAAPAEAEAGAQPAAEEPAEAPRRGADGAEAANKAPASLAVEPDVPAGTEMVRTTVREALRDAMAEEMRKDERVFVMGEEVAEYQGAYKVTQGLLDEFGAKRVIDTPITEYGFAGVGTGAAMGGLRPVIEFMTFNFAMQAIDHIINSAAKTNYMSGGQMRCPIVFRGPNGAASRVGAQHSQNYGPWYAAVPGLIVIAPYSAADAKGLLKAAIRSEDPVVFLENELLYGQSFDVPKLDDYVLPIGKARVVREGKDVTLVTYSIGVGVALDAAAKLAEEGIDAEVIDLRTLAPARQGDGARQPRQDQPHGLRRGRLAGLLDLVRADGGRDGGGVRRSRRAGAARHRRGRAAALCRQSREAGADQGRRRRRGGEEGLLPLPAERR